MLQNSPSAKLHAKSLLTTYFLSYCLKSTTTKLSHCSLYIIGLTVLNVSHIVAHGGKKWVKVGAHQAQGKGGVVFRGVSHLVLDNKGRLAIPAKHRESLSSNGDAHL